MCHGKELPPCIVGFAMMLTVALPPLVFAENPVPQKREKIGEVLGKSVYRDQIQTGQDVDLAEELPHSFFWHPCQISIAGSTRPRSHPRWRKSTRQQPGSTNVIKKNASMRIRSFVRC